MDPLHDSHQTSTLHTILNGSEVDQLASITAPQANGLQPSTSTQLLGHPSSGGPSLPPMAPSTASIQAGTGLYHPTAQDLGVYSELLPSTYSMLPLSQPPSQLRHPFGLTNTLFQHQHQLQFLTQPAAASFQLSHDPSIDGLTSQSAFQSHSYAQQLQQLQHHHLLQHQLAQQLLCNQAAQQMPQHPFLDLQDLNSSMAAPTTNPVLAVKATINRGHPDAMTHQSSHQQTSSSFPFSTQSHFPSLQPVQHSTSPPSSSTSVSSRTAVSSSASPTNLYVPHFLLNVEEVEKTRREGLEESTSRILQFLQTRGKMPFKDIHKELTIDYRRAYDILNVLLTTPLVTRTGKKRENKLPYVYSDGKPLSEPVSIDRLAIELTARKKLNDLLKLRIARLEEELAKPSIDPSFFQELLELDPNIQQDPMYKEVFASMN